MPEICLLPRFVFTSFMHKCKNQLFENVSCCVSIVLDN